LARWTVRRGEDAMKFLVYGLESSETEREVSNIPQLLA